MSQNQHPLLLIRLSKHEYLKKPFISRWDQVVSEILFYGLYSFPKCRGFYNNEVGWCKSFKFKNVIQLFETSSLSVKIGNEVHSKQQIMHFIKLLLKITGPIELQNHKLHFIELSIIVFPSSEKGL